MARAASDNGSVRFTVIPSRIGFIGLVATPRGVRRTYLPMRAEGELRRQIRRDFAEAVEDKRLMPALVKKLKKYVAGEAVAFDETIDWSWAGDFEAAVWKACHRVGFGATTSYGELADAIGCPGAARAVGTALGKNPCPILIPCHRVLKSDGSIGGWSGPGGLDQKRMMLDLEAAALMTS